VEGRIARYPLDFRSDRRWESSIGEDEEFLKGYSFVQSSMIMMATLHKSEEAL
jgi:hypothetical protein